MATTPHHSNPLADRLKDARGTMTGRRLSDLTGWPPSKISKIETGRQAPSLEDLQTWARHTEVGETVLAQWLSMREQLIAERHTHAEDFRGGQSALQRAYHEMLERCTHFVDYEKMFVPRVLQTPDYTRGLVENVHRLHRRDVPLDSEAAQRDIAAAVTTRQASANYLFDPQRRFELILDEAALRTWRFSTEIMRAQLLRIQSVIGLPNVRLGIFPQNRIVVETADNSFAIYDDVAYVETVTGEQPVVRADEVQAYRDCLERLWTEALEGPEALRLIEEIRQSIPV